MRREFYSDLLLEREAECMSDITIVHTWRDGCFLHAGEMTFDNSEMGALIVGKKNNLRELYEIRHLKGQTTADWGHIIYWLRSTDEGWDSEYLGQATEEYLRFDYQV